MALPFPEIVNEFNREQQEFIKTKGNPRTININKTMTNNSRNHWFLLRDFVYVISIGDAESGIVSKPQEGLAPWIGYQEEDAMKAKVEFINTFNCSSKIIPKYFNFTLNWEMILFRYTFRYYRWVQIREHLFELLQAAWPSILTMIQSLQLL